MEPIAEIWKGEDYSPLRVRPAADDVVPDVVIEGQEAARSAAKPRLGLNGAHS